MARSSVEANNRRTNGATAPDMHYGNVPIRTGYPDFSSPSMKPPYLLPCFAQLMTQFFRHAFAQQSVGSRAGVVRRFLRNAIGLGRLLSIPRIVGGIDVIDLPRAHTVELNDRLSFGPRGVFHASRPVTERAGR
jgi:hypothetical protein